MENDLIALLCLVIVVFVLAHALQKFDDFKGTLLGLVFYGRQEFMAEKITRQMEIFSASLSIFQCRSLFAHSLYIKKQLKKEVIWLIS